MCMQSHVQFYGLYVFIELWAQLKVGITPFYAREEEELNFFSFKGFWFRNGLVKKQCTCRVQNHHL